MFPRHSETCFDNYLTLRIEPQIPFTEQSQMRSSGLSRTLVPPVPSEPSDLPERTTQDLGPGRSTLSIEAVTDSLINLLMTGKALQSSG